MKDFIKHKNTINIILSVGYIIHFIFYATKYAFIIIETYIILYGKP